jgi:hypothetical protein
MSHSENSPDIGPTTSYYQGRDAGRIEERERITANIRERVADLMLCTKKDTCHELARFIDSYIEEWTEPGQSVREYEHDRSTEEYLQGMSDSGDVLYGITDRLRDSLHDMEEMTGVEVDMSKTMLNLILERYSERIWERRDSLR